MPGFNVGPSGDSKKLSYHDAVIDAEAVLGGTAGSWSDKIDIFGAKAIYVIAYANGNPGAGIAVGWGFYLYGSATRKMYSTSAQGDLDIIVDTGPNNWSYEGGGSVFKMMPAATGSRVPEMCHISQYLDVRVDATGIAGNLTYSLDVAVQWF